MISEIYGIYDEASEAFVQFIPCLNEKIATMTLEKMFKEKRISLPMIYDYPNTFKAYKLGTFNDNTGLFENLSQHEMLLDFGSLVAVSSNQICSNA